MRRLSRSWLLLSLLASAAPASALPVTLSLVPSDDSIVPGQVFSVSVVVGGLSDVESQIALESFDLSLEFDASKLQFQSLGFGSRLGDPSNASQTFLLPVGTPNTTGVATLGEFSFLTEAQLLGLQNVSSFTLATVQLKAVEGLGNTQIQLIDLDSSSLGGVGGQALGDDLTPPGSISVTLVPEPGAALLVALAGAALRRGRRGAG